MQPSLQVNRRTRTLTMPRSAAIGRVGGSAVFDTYVSERTGEILSSGLRTMPASRTAGDAPKLELPEVLPAQGLTRGDGNLPPAAGWSHGGRDLLSRLGSYRAFNTIAQFALDCSRPDEPLGFQHGTRQSKLVLFREH